MGRVSKTLILLILSCSAGFAQTPNKPEFLLGVVDGGYELFAPRDAVEAGGGALEADLPLPSNALPLATGTPSQGTSPRYSRQDHVHLSSGGGGGVPLSNNDPVALGTAASGDGTTASRDDHVHPTTGLALTSQIPQPSNANPLNPGTASQGTSTRYSRQDHVHNLQSVPVASDTNPTPLGTATAGSNATFSRSDHRHPTTGIRQYPNFTSANKNDCFRVDSAGSAVGWRDCPTSGGGGGAPLSDNDPVALGTAGPGDGESASRDDHVHPTTGLALTSQLPQPSNANPLSPANNPSQGTSTRYSRQDHRHEAQQVPLGSITVPKSVGSANLTGTGIRWARSDHAHKGELPSVTGQAGNVLTVNSAANGIEWKAVSGGGGGGGGAVLKEIYASSSLAFTSNYKNFTIPNVDGSCPIKSDTIYVVSINPQFSAIITSFWQTPSGTSGTTTQTIEHPPTGPDFQFRYNNNNLCTISYRVTTSFNLNAVFEIYEISGGGGGGGTTGPTIPTPTGPGNYLRVASNNTYELGMLPAQTRYEPLASGSFQHSGGGSATVNFAQTGQAASLHNHVISGRYEEFVLFAQYNNPLRGERLTNCNIAGVQPPETLNNMRTVTAFGVIANPAGLSRCSIGIPTTGNVTVNWENIGEGGLNTTFTWYLTGVRWP